MPENEQNFSNPLQKYNILPHSKYLEMLNSEEEISEKQKFREEKVYRKNSHQLQCIHKFSLKTGKKISTTTFDYFNDKKIKSIDEYDEKSGKIIRTTNFTLFKSITEYSRTSGKKLKTTNYSIKDENRITSVYEYDNLYEKVMRISIYQPDGKSISMVKEINPISEIVEKCINYKRNSNSICSISKYEFQGDKTVKTTCYYNDCMEGIREFFSPKIQTKQEKNNAKLIDNLFKNNLNVSTLQL